MQPFFFFKPSPTPVIYTLSLHDALPICRHDRLRRRCLRREPHVIADRIGDDDGIRRRYTPALTIGTIGSTDSNFGTTLENLQLRTADPPPAGRVRVQVPARRAGSVVSSPLTSADPKRPKWVDE